ncbi:MAG: diversity-generating retroelement protein Avd [Myxococcales bacterium]|nr:diversity-generating retroelement protein Avd [Myxococcales bacterium]
MKKDLPAIQKAYDLAKEVLVRLAKFPRDHKFTLGDRIADNVLTVLELLVQAAYTKKKVDLLDEANIRLERLRMLLRLSRELGALSDKGYEHVMGILTDLGQQLGGWRKQASGDG